MKLAQTPKSVLKESMTKPVQDRPVAGVLWMLMAGICFILVNALVKLVGQRVPAPEAAFLRYAMGLVFLIPMLRTMVSTPVSGRLWGQFATRGLMHGMGVMLWFYAMARIPLADVTAINYLSPIYVTLGAAMFLGEKLAIRRIAAVVFALIGSVVILRPGVRAIEFGHWAMMGAALVFGASYILAKVTVDKSNPALVLGMLSFWVTVVLAPFAWAVWVPPTLHEIGILFAVAFFATAGHYMMTLAMAAAPLSVTQPVTFLQLVWAMALGYFAFGEPIDLWVVAGGVIIIASVTFITLREAALNRRPVTPPAIATKL